MSAKALKFTVSGRWAFFKKPDVNERVYFTFNNIHRIALLGMLGAVIGLKGYKNHQLFKETVPDYPEYYEKLNLLKISIVPDSKNGYFSKKIQYFNNSTGFASFEEGGNLMVREQWIENPSWTIYLMQGEISDKLWNKLCDYLLRGKCIYYPYLGKNDFPAKIADCSMVELMEGEFDHIDSIYYGEIDQVNDLSTIDGLPFLFREMSPTAMVQNINFYQYERSIFTNYRLWTTEGLNLMSYQGKVLYFR